MYVGFLSAVLVTRVASSSQRGGALDANLGDAIEEFMHYAEDLKHHVAKGVPWLSPG